MQNISGLSGTMAETCRPSLRVVIMEYLELAILETGRPSLVLPPLCPGRVLCLALDIP